MKNLTEAYTLVALTDQNAAQWDEFVLSEPTGSVHQLSSWVEFQTKIPGREVAKGFGVRDKKGDFVATVICVQMDTGFLGKKWWYSARGPVVNMQKNAAAAEFLFRMVKRNLTQHGGMFWRVDPYFSETDWQRILDLETKPAVQNYQPTDTLMLDLTKSDEELLKEMKRKGRYNIKQAQKHEIKYEVYADGKFTKEALQQFWDLNIATTDRDGFSGHQKEYYRHFLRSLPETAVLFLAKKDETPVAAAISTFAGSKAIYYFGASTSDNALRKLMAPYGLQWRMIQYAKEKGCKTYDFLGIAPEGEENHPYAGISEFKWKFGGYRDTFVAGKEIPLNGFWYWVYRVMKKLRK
ncbi:hypothetical protein CSB37_02060 [bacterium DOLZORAL124_38_8]|nr:MAG: hypothetical protein CSB37_02060 [bacterium DOLZORAL124_38_8]